MDADRDFSQSSTHTMTWGLQVSTCDCWLLIVDRELTGAATAQRVLP